MRNVKWAAGLLLLLFPFSIFHFSSSAVAADLSTPKAAASSLYQAVQNADETAIAQLLYASGNQGQALVQATARLMVAGRHLQTAARKKWGKSAEPLVEDMTAADELKDINNATVTEKGDHAEMRLAESARAMQFIRIHGHWLLQLDDIPIPHPKRRISRIEHVAQVLEKAAGDIASGQYDSPQKARVDIGKRLEAAMEESAAQ